METHRLNMSVLSCPKQFSRAADLEIAHRNRIASAQLCVLRNNIESLLSIQSRCYLPMSEKICIRAHRPPTDPAPLLVELSQTKCIRTVYDQGIGIWNIQSRFNYGRGEKNISFTSVEIMHYIG
jgi:hypothetical protein